MQPERAASDEPARIIERIARESYGRLVAFLAAGSRDLPAAEDALGDALHAALRTWPRDGAPPNPEAWLLVTARRRLADAARRVRVRDRVAPLLAATPAGDAATGDDTAMFPDERLKLLFVCAHPAIDPAVHTPLMLQTVLGLDAERIASAFLVSPAAMSQRLVRAKAKIKAAGIPFAVPEPAELPGRLEAVLEAIYAAYATGWDNAFGADAFHRGLTDEAIWLARATADLQPAAPEARGLLALLLHCEARRPARRSPAGDYVPLAEQDPARWSQPLLREAEQQLAAAAAVGRPGRFQLEAAIQSLHAQQSLTGASLGAARVRLYDQLVRVSPTLGAHVSRAAAVGEAFGPGAGLAALDALPAAETAAYQPYWATRAHLLARGGRHAEAGAAYTRAIGLTEDPALRRFLLERQQRALAAGGCAASSSDGS